MSTLSSWAAALPPSVFCTQLDLVNPLQYQIIKQLFKTVRILLAPPYWSLKETANIVYMHCGNKTTDANNLLNHNGVLDSDGTEK